MKRVASLLAFSLLSLVAVVAGCGGGVGTGGTGSYAQGTITGFGSIIVGGVRYDEAGAAVTDIDNVARSRDDLKLGMTVEVEAGEVANGAAVARSVRFTSELTGEVATVDAAAGRLTLLGQTVETDAATVFDETLAGGLAALAVGQRVEVHAGWDPAARVYRATRIEPSSGNGVFRLRGVASELSAAARTVKIGTGSFTWSGNTPAGLADGAFVRVQLQNAPAGTAVWTIVGSAAGGARPPEGSQANVKGLISAFTSLASFNVNGVVVNASGASFPDGNALAVGVRVKVFGKVTGGVLLATEVRIESDDEQTTGFDLTGPVASLDAAARRFRLRGNLVSWSDGTAFEGGSAANLANGRQVQVIGQPSADGTRIEALRIVLR